MMLVTHRCGNRRKAVVAALIRCSGQISCSVLQHQYEDKQQQLIKSQKELVSFKQKYTEADNRCRPLTWLNFCFDSNFEDLEKTVPEI